MGGKRIELEGEARKSYVREKAREYQRKRRGFQVRSESIGRTGNEEVLGWRMRRGSEESQMCLVDPYYKNAIYQTKAVWNPDKDGGVLNLQVVLQGWEKPDVLGALKDTFTFGRHILVSEDVKGTDRFLWQAYLRQPDRPSEETIQGLFRRFCLSP